MFHLAHPPAAGGDARFDPISGMPGRHRTGRFLRMLHAN
jgi:hypothetical protein